MAPLSLSSTIKLLNGTSMPILGFGVWQSSAPHASTTSALNSGYTHIDCARIYRSEVLVGEAVEAWKVKNEGGGDVYLTSKITGKEHGIKTRAAVEESIERLPRGMKWDLFLLHDPTSGPVRRLEAWNVLEQFVEEGKLTSIGVSNFVSLFLLPHFETTTDEEQSDVHLREFVAAGVSKPLVNQIELHPWCQQKPIVAYCQREGIVLQAYCPIVRGERMDDPVLQSIVKKVGRTPAQVLIRWSLQKGYVPLPKSDTPSRIIENRNVFDFVLDDESMAALDSLDEGAAGACSWNPVGHK